MSAEDKLARLAELARSKLGKQEPTDPAGPVYHLGAAATAEWRRETREAFRRLRDAKERVNYPHTEKMVDTVVALVDARLSGEPETPVFDRPDTCAYQTYHAKWKHDPDFATCLADVTRLAREWKDNRVASKIREAAEKLAIAAPQMTDIAIATAVQAFQAGDHPAALRAAFGILDRADVKTAVKSGVAVNASVARSDVVNLTELDPDAANAFLANVRVLQETAGDEDEADAMHPMDDAGPG
jgi:hypothetical protein